MINTQLDGSGDEPWGQLKPGFPLATLDIQVTRHTLCDGLFVSICALQ